MALINCPECGKEVSDKSEKCVYCGYPLNKPKRDVNNEKVSGIIEKTYKENQMVGLVSSVIIGICGLAAIIYSFFTIGYIPLFCLYFIGGLVLVGIGVGGFIYFYRRLKQIKQSE